jgi:hypothetical protein
MKMGKTWSMPNSSTFSIKPIYNLIEGYIDNRDIIIVDPFVRDSPFKKLCISNDLDSTIEADYNLDALDFLKGLESDSVDMVLYDPPYSPRQISECYKKMGKAVNMETTQASFWTYLKKRNC